MAEFSRSDLRSYQPAAAKFVQDTRRCALWVDMRMGKTAITLTAFADMQWSLEAERLLVFAPDYVVREHVWEREAKKWDHLKHLKIATVHNAHKTRGAELQLAAQSKADVVVVSYTNLLWLIAKLHSNWPFDMVVVDESSFFKSHNTKRFVALSHIVDTYNPRLVELTGTPTSSGGLLNLWPQIYMLDKGQRLGKTFASYQHRFFENPDRQGYRWVPFEESKEDIHSRVADLVFRLDAKDHIYLPEPIPGTTWVDLPPKLQAVYDELEKEFLLEFEGEPDIEAVSEGVLANKLVQFADGAVYDEEQNARVFHELKLDALEGFLRECGDRVLLAYNYQFSRDMLMDRFPFARHSKERGALQAWCDGKVDLLITHGGTVAYGLDLWPGGHTACWFGNNWSLEITQQFNARLKHPSQSHVFINRIVTRGTRDEDVLHALHSGAETQRELFEVARQRTLSRVHH